MNPYAVAAAILILTQLSVGGVNIPRKTRNITIVIDIDTERSTIEKRKRII